MLIERLQAMCPWRSYRPGVVRTSAGVVCSWHNSPHAAHVLGIALNRATTRCSTTIAKCIRPLQVRSVACHPQTHAIAMHCRPRSTFRARWGNTMVLFEGQDTTGDALHATRPVPRPLALLTTRSHTLSAKLTQAWLLAD